MKKSVCRTEGKRQDGENNSVSAQSSMSCMSDRTDPVLSRFNEYRSLELVSCINVKIQHVKKAKMLLITQNAAPLTTKWQNIL